MATRRAPGLAASRDRGQQAGARGVVPVVQDHRQEIHVGGGHRREEIAAHGVDPVILPERCDPALRGGHHMREVEHDAAPARVGVGIEKLRQHAPVGAADVGDDSTGGQAVAADRCGLDAVGEVGHRAGEAEHLLLIGGEPIEERPAVVQRGGGLPRKDAVEQPPERRIVGLHPGEGQVAHRPGGAAGQRLAQRCQAVGVGIELGEHADAGEGAQQTL